MAAVTAKHPIEIVDDQTDEQDAEDLQKYRVELNRYFLRSDETPKVSISTAFEGFEGFAWICVKQALKNTVRDADIQTLVDIIRPDPNHGTNERVARHWAKIISVPSIPAKDLVHIFAVGYAARYGKRAGAKTRRLTEMDEIVACLEKENDYMLDPEYPRRSLSTDMETMAVNCFHKIPQDDAVKIYQRAILEHENVKKALHDLIMGFVTSDLRWTRSKWVWPTGLFAILRDDTRITIPEMWMDYCRSHMDRFPLKVDE